MRYNPWFRWSRCLRLLAIALCAALIPCLAQAQWVVDPEFGPMLPQKVLDMEARFEAEFEDYFDADLATVRQSNPEISQTLAELGDQTGSPAAVIWAIARDSHLHLKLTTSTQTIVRDRYDVPRDRLNVELRRFYRDLTRRQNRSYPAAGQNLYQWLVGMFEADYLEPEGIETLLFCFGEGLRGLPVAALHDGEKYLVEKYASSLIPAFNLIDTRYQKIQQGQIIALGASEFSTLPSLPAVPVELATITTAIRASLPPDVPWRGQALLNEAFTLANFKTQLQQQSHAIVHLATHAEFQSGEPANSYIQFWDDERLGLDQMQQIDWGEPPPELLVLSACRTIIGDASAELGFAGLALQAGVKSALASRWYVSDAGTLALMSEFYRQLPAATTKAEALRRAQLNLLRGNVRLVGDHLQLSRGSVALPADLENNDEELTHPFYWASFLMISSPW
ncbi:MAG: CHAT domain-containing protein [Spirulinaceae cyanobacterium SM2_1_0]|nr:CHAT domain-containing protein [Spirulinaceae cyanobacterium SM2_1_0]